jgi:hypothetical protein
VFEPLTPCESTKKFHFNNVARRRRLLEKEESGGSRATQAPNNAD